MRDSQQRQNGAPLLGLQCHHLTRAEGLVGRDNNLHGVDRIIHVIAEVFIVLDSIEKKDLFTMAELIMIRFVSR